MQKTFRNLICSFIFTLALALSFGVFAASLPEIKTTLTDTMTGDNPGPEKDSFTKNTPMIYVVYQSDQLKPGQSLQSIWIADDTNNVAPAHYIIDQKTLTLPKGNAGDTIIGKFSLSKPNAGWPVGEYHVDIYLDKQLIKTIKFSIKA